MLIKKHYLKKSAIWLDKKNISANNLSVLGLVFALLSSVSFWHAFSWTQPLGFRWLLFVAVLSIQARLVCHALATLIAKQSQAYNPERPLYHLLIDRISDIFILLGVGYGLTLFPTATTTAWVTVVVALLSAYLRLLNKLCGLKQSLSAGPMTKLHRMMWLSISVLIALFLPLEKAQLLLFISLWTILLGGLFTILFRANDMVHALSWKTEAKNKQKTKE